MHKNIIVLLISIASLGFGVASAQTIAEQPCDTKFWDQMSSRAWLEAEREIMQNQNLIFKPDSVLDYTCFDQFAKIAAAQGGEIFVHTSYFGEKIIQRGSAQSTDQGINGVVYLPLFSYKRSNFSANSNFSPDNRSSQFSGSFLGGRSQSLQASNTDHTPTAPTSSTSESYNCANMSAVWQAAKCANFIDNDRFKLTDGFYPFETIKGLKGEDVVGYSSQESGGPGIDETRQFPSPCTRGTGIRSWSLGVIEAENRGESMYQFQTPLGNIFKEVNDKIEPGKCENVTIRTGVSVITTDGEQGPDGVCTNPGCTFTRESGCTDAVDAG